jgi:hypothetical protein
MIKKLGYTFVRYTSKPTTCSDINETDRSKTDAEVTFLRVPRNSVTFLMNLFKTNMQNNCYMNRSPIAFLPECLRTMIWKFS